MRLLDWIYGGFIFAIFVIVLSALNGIADHRKFQNCEAARVEAVILKAQELEANIIGLGEVLDSIDRIDGIRFEELENRARNNSGEVKSNSERVGQLTKRSNRHNEVLTGVLQRQKALAKFVKEHGHKELVKE